MSYAAAHERIYLPSYEFQLKKQDKLVRRLLDLATRQPVILVDYYKNASLGSKTPLSHAQLLKYWLENGGTLDGYVEKYGRRAGEAVVMEEDDDGEDEE